MIGLAVTAAVLACVALTIPVVLKRRAPPQPTASASTEALPSASAAPQASVGPASPAQDPPPPTVRTERVAVAPAGVVVEVDGKPAAVENGTVAVTGSLGSIHPVRLTLGARTSTHDVIVTEVGAMPAQVALDAAASPKPLRK
jgi:hypothetical protein